MHTYNFLMRPDKLLTLRGVRVHNLKNIDVAIPLGRLTIVTGVSGAGKSSLVFDTLYAEAQRRYLQSFSTYARQFLERFEKPDAEEIGDLPPAVAIRRSPREKSPHATVASLTEIGDHLRLLFARADTIVCPTCGAHIKSCGTADVVAALQALPAGTRCAIGFAATAPEAVDLSAWLTALLEEGYIRIKTGGVIYRLDEHVPSLPPGHDIWVLLDRVEIGTTSVERLTESVDAGFGRGAGRVGYLTDTDERIFDQRLTCSRCQRTFVAPEPRLFDLSDPLGACPACRGTGNVKDGICSGCQGRRWNENALAVRLDGRTIADWHEQPLKDLLAWTEAQAKPAAVQIRQRLQSLVELDLGYLTLGQPAATLADGATRRITLASALASDLVNVLYLIDEPTTGLHPRDTDKLIDVLRRLRNRGNTVVVIEHDRRIIAAADHVIDLGPGAGEEGGQITYQGPPTGLSTAPENPTSDFWTGRSFIEVPPARRKPTGVLTLTGAAVNNLQDLTVGFPLGVLCVVTGVSGAGKRSLVEQTLYSALCLAKKKEGADPATKAKITGAQRVTDVVLFDQRPLPRSARSNAATYLKIFDAIRELFAATVDAKIRNFGPAQFSFNQPGGRCETCEGQGSLTIDMQFLADVTTLCPECQGRRYRKEILDIKVRSLSIAQVLDLTVREAFRFFRAQAAIQKKLKVLLDVGLDYLRLGQALETLAGGECQRLKLAGQLASSRKTGCLFLLIEPTAGLHPADVANLLECFDHLLAAGHSLIVIEHDLDVIQCADHIIDLGPEGGKEGGRVVAQGAPEDVAKVAASHIARMMDRVT
jgi:excinuclease ABC subunit A